jgi:hypothetical protein
MRLECDFPLPELAESTSLAGPAWLVETRGSAAPAVPFGAIGSDTVYGEVRVRAFARADSMQLVFDDTGTFDVRQKDRTIAWYPGPRPVHAAVRADLLGRVMALAAHADGRIALHASAVSIDGRAIAFLGPKHAGKSTLALALVRRGARLLTDDTLVLSVDSSEGVVAMPGVQRMRLWEDSARALGARLTESAQEAKPMTDALPSALLERSAVALGACYVLGATSSSSTGAAIERQRLSPVHAALACVQFSKLGALLGGDEATVVLDRAAAVSSAAAVYAAEVRRDLASLDEVASRLVGWHGSVPRSTTAGAS